MTGRGPQLPGVMAAVAEPARTAPRPVPAGSTLLTVDDLHVEFAGRHRTVRAVRGLSYEIRTGETLGLVGESGSGKSVSALSLLGLLPKRAGRVTRGSARFEGRELIGMPDEELRRVRGAKIAMIFQDPLSSLNPVLTVGRQITEALETHRSMNRRAAHRRAVELLDLVGIPGAARRIHDYPHQFSGGMRQRAMIAMALSCEPSLLIADEPTTALDVTIQAQILALLRRLREELGMAVLLITHDLGVVAGFADRLAVMYAGRLVEVGPTEELLADPAHPYTIGLLRSLPRLDRPRQAELTPIEGSPPDLAADLIGCPFAPRCAWRTDDSWKTNPPLEPARGVAGGNVRAHLVACHNQPQREEAIQGLPLRKGFVAAPPPSRVLSALEQAAVPLTEEELVVFDAQTGAGETLAAAGAAKRAAEQVPERPSEQPSEPAPAEPPDRHDEERQ
ncbi:MAG TPA: ABC transporter ATP-binding protein [Candidatus Limnocylindrales bacterium]|nr:ABC transporter ATP-binding protein [Candidatus Limnocylindrales bacterium]